MEYTKCCILHRHLILLLFIGATVDVQEASCAKFPGEKTITTLYSIRNNIDMIRLVRYVLIPNKNTKSIVSFVNS